MPVTAKLPPILRSVWDDIVNELVDWMNAVDTTYRSEPRETNELNFARFMSSVDQRFVEQGTRIEKRFAEMNTRSERGFAEADTQLGNFKAEVLNWMFIYWTGTMAPLAGLVFAVLRTR